MGSAVRPRPAGSAPAEAGFTLLELLVAVGVLSVLAVAAVLALPSATPPQMRDVALLRARHAAQREAAILSGQPRGLMLDRQGLALTWLVLPQDTTTPRWQQGLRQPWATTAQPTLSPASGRGQGAPDVLFLPDGRSTPYAIRFRAGLDGQSCQSDGWSTLQCAPE